MLNALAAVAVGLDLEMPYERIQAALAAFAGVFTLGGVALALRS